jgi:hypothetical protein
MIEISWSPEGIISRLFQGSVGSSLSEAAAEEEPIAVIN